jgi:hypothetical protein
MRSRLSRTLTIVAIFGSLALVPMAVSAQPANIQSPEEGVKVRKLPPKVLAAQCSPGLKPCTYGSLITCCKQSETCDNNHGVPYCR